MDEIITPQPTGSGITPQMPVEPPKEALETKFEFDPKMFDEHSPTVITTDKGVEIKTEEPTKKVELPATDNTKTAAKLEPKQELKTEEVKTEDKKISSSLKPPVDTKTLPKSDNKPAVKPITPVKDKKEDADTFDYSKYSQQHQTNMRNMSRQSREAYAEILKQNEELAKLKDSTYLQHEQGYTLSPEYQEIRQRGTMAEIEGQCWKQSLLDIKAGKEFKEIIGWNQDGSPKFAAPRVATDEDEIRIANNLSACIGAVQQVRGQLTQYPVKFKEQLSADMQAINNERAARFAWVQDPKLLDYTVETEHAGTQKVSDIKSNFKSLFPVYVRNNPGVEVASDLMVALMIQSAELRESQASRTVAEIEKKEIARSEPTSYDRQTGESGVKTVNGHKVPATFSLEGLPG